MSDILIINGPNLNLLGTREPDVYGTQSLDDIENRLNEIASQSVKLEFLQSNAEHEIIDAIQLAKKNGVKFIIINPGPLTHTSIALRDTFLSTQIPFIEVHISNIFKREEFRKKSFISEVADGVIFGFGSYSYILAVMAMKNLLK